MDHRAAIARAGRRIDGIERPKLENVFGVDRVGIAQPVLDLGDAELRRPRIERRAWARARCRLDALGAVQVARPGHVLLSALERALPVFARHRGKPLHEARGDGRRAAELGGAGQDDLARAGKLREVVRREPDAPLGQIEAEVVAHRPREPRIGARVGWPDAFDQSAEHHAVDGHEARFERAEDAHALARGAGAAADLRRDSRLEQLWIVADVDGQIIARALLGDLGESVRKRCAIIARERGGRPGVVARERGQYLTVQLRQRDERVAPFQTLG